MCIGVAVLLLVGPLLGQVFGVRTASVYPRWRMFTGIARDVCQVEYSLVSADGSRHVLDHRAILRWPTHTASGRAVGIKTSSLDQVHARMCWALGAAARPVDLRVRARCGSRARWINRSSEASSVCR